MNAAQRHVACSALRAEHEAQIERERRNFGDAMAAIVEARGIPAYDVEGYSSRQWQALARRGLVSLCASVIESESFRRGAYGRWIGGARTSRTAIVMVRLTDAGRALAEGK